MKNSSLFTLTLCTVLLVASAVAANAQSPCAKTDYDCLIRTYRAQIDKDPKNIEAYYSLAAALHDKGDYAAALDPLDTYIASGVPKPEYVADAYALRGWSQHKMGSYDMAVQDLTKAIALFPKALFYYRRGRSNSEMKQYARTIADDNKAIGLDPKFTSAYFDRGFANMSQEIYPPAIADFTKVIEMDPDNHEAFYNRGTVYYRQKQYALAIRDLDKYVSMNVTDQSNLADGYINRGLAKYYSGNTNDAVADLTKATMLSPDNKHAYTYRAMAYRKLGKTALADADEKKAADLQ